jgi:fatty acid-binding protein DegV
MVESCLRSRHGHERLHAAILHARAEDLASELHALLSREVADGEVFVAPFSSVMVVHTGPDLVGLAWRWGEAD